jgi:phosphatidylserine/phosphatidylglycerophosphate/cardiolipin synthase-like enzyme
MRLPEGGVAGEVELLEIAESGWTEAIAVSANSENGISAYFNRGMVMSQYVARIIREKKWKPEDILPHIKELEDPLRVFLSGELRKEMLKIIGEVWIDPGLELYAALYELNDRELIDGLKLLRERAHILLANGSDKDHDENLMARGELIKANVDVRDRLLRGKGLGHNKFAVVVAVEENKKYAIKAWTGSTNWSSTGLCTQLNNGILIEGKEIAEIFLQQWHRLDNAGNCFTEKLIDANDKSPRSAGCVDVWFTPMHNNFGKNEADAGTDLQALIKLVNNAKHAILFVMFEPGDKSELVSSIFEMSKNIYVRGVKNTVRNSKETFSLHEKGQSEEFNTPVIQPQGIEKGFSAWVDEITRKQFITTEKHEGIGHAITHAKMIVIDPLDDNCKVVTGSHNFSKSASERNDENFLVIHGNRPLAEAYAVSCLATYSHYRWRAYLEEKTRAHEKPWSHLSSDPNWQAEYLSKERKKHLDLWCKQ